MATATLLRRLNICAPLKRPSKEKTLLRIIDLKHLFYMVLQLSGPIAVFGLQP
jgi:hypothetical protein